MQQYTSIWLELYSRYCRYGHRTHYILPHTHTLHNPHTLAVVHTCHTPPGHPPQGRDQSLSQETGHHGLCAASRLCPTCGTLACGEADLEILTRNSPLGRKVSFLHPKMPLGNVHLA